MLKIAICDDQPKELETLEALTKEFAEANCPEAEITAFSHPDALATAYENTSFHIYLLDMVMPMLNGLDLGRGIRRVSTDAQIIYITTEPGYALTAYAVNPLHYLLKPVKREELFAALTLAVSKADFGREILLTLKTHGGIRTISTNRVACCECRHHTAVYTLTDGEILETTTLTGSFAEHIAPLLTHPHFISPHVSFAVNMSRVERLKKEGFFLHGGEFVPVSGKQYAAVRNAYMNYRLGERGSMSEHFPDFLRAIVSAIANVLLIVTLLQPKYSKKVTTITMLGILAADLGTAAYCYLSDNLTLLAKIDMVLVLALCFAVRPLFKDTFMQWVFSCLTVQNISNTVIVLSFVLSRKLPYPMYANSAIRFVLFAIFFVLLRYYLRPLYRQAVEHWAAYFAVAFAIYLTFTYYVLFSDNIVITLAEQSVPLLLVIFIGISAYGSIFLSLKSLQREYAVKAENHSMQMDRELTRQRLALMDEAVSQMSTARHDQRHFNHAVSTLLTQGEVSQAVALLEQSHKSLPPIPQTYCQNVSVNAAVSYYAQQAKWHGIRCDIRLNIPKNLQVDELSLSMAVSNLMENAVTACAEVPEEARFLHFTAVDTGQLLLQISNPYVSEITWDKNGLPVAQTQGHGQGSQSVAAFVKSCDGELVYEVADGIFRVRLMV